MTFNQAVRTGFQKYADFSSRASRPEYWYWWLFYIAGAFVVLLFTKLYYLWEIGLFVPGLSVGVRRMHDSDHSGWWVLCPVANIVLLFFPSTGPNRFGVGNAPHGLIDESQLSGTSSACGVCGKLRLPGQSFCQGCGTKFD